VPSSSPLSAFFIGIPSNALRKPILAPLKRWHAVIGHLRAELLSYLEEHTTRAKIEKSTKPLTPYEAYTISKVIEIVS
jgi:hypothetical protein